MGNFRAFLTRSRYVNAIRNSLIVAVGATAIATVLAVSLAYFFVTTSPASREWLP